jgi:hypothetical protein
VNLEGDQVDAPLAKGCVQQLLDYRETTYVASKCSVFCDIYMTLLSPLARLPRGNAACATPARIKTAASLSELLTIDGFIRPLSPV